MYDVRFHRDFHFGLCAGCCAVCALWARASARPTTVTKLYQIGANRSESLSTDCVLVEWTTLLVSVPAPSSQINVGNKTTEA